MAYDAAPEAWAVGKEGVQRQKEAMAQVRQAKGVKAKAKAFGKGYVEGLKFQATGLARVGAASVVGSDAVKMGREALAEKRAKEAALKKNSAASFIVRGGRQMVKRGGKKVAQKVAGRSITGMVALAGGSLVTAMGLGKQAAREYVETKDILKGVKKNPSQIAANVAEINRFLRSMPSNWRAQLAINRAKLREAGASAGQIPPLKPDAHSVLLALNLNNRGEVSSEAAAGQEQPDGVSVPDDVRETAMEGVRESFKNNYGGYHFIGLARAIQLAISPSISDAALNRMRLYFDRKTKQDRLSSQYEDKYGPRYWSWLNWGGDPGAVWSKSKRFRELVGGSMQNRRNPAPGITMTQWYADVANEDWANWDLNRAGIMHYSPRGMPTYRSIVKSNPFEFKPESFDQRLRRMGMTGHTVYLDRETGVETKVPKMVMFDDPEAALKALAVFLVLEKVDVRGATAVPSRNQKQAAVLLADGRMFIATLGPRNDLRVEVRGVPGGIDWFAWAQVGVYPVTSAK